MNNRAYVTGCTVYGKENIDFNNCGIYGRTFTKCMPSYEYLGQLDWYTPYKWPFVKLW